MPTLMTHTGIGAAYRKWGSRRSMQEWGLQLVCVLCFGVLLAWAGRVRAIRA